MEIKRIKVEPIPPIPGLRAAVPSGKPGNLIALEGWFIVPGTQAQYSFGRNLEDKNHPYRVEFADIDKKIATGFDMTELEVETLIVGLQNLLGRKESDGQQLPPPRPEQDFE